MIQNKYITNTFPVITNVDLVKVGSVFLKFLINGTSIGLYSKDAYSFEYEVASTTVTISVFRKGLYFGSNISQQIQSLTVDVTTLKVNGTLCTSISDFESKLAILLP